MCTVAILPPIWMYLYISPNLIHGRPITVSHEFPTAASAPNLTGHPVSSHFRARASVSDALQEQKNNVVVNKGRFVPSAAPTTSKFFVTLVMPTVPREAANGERPNYLSQVIRKYHAQAMLLDADHPPFRILVANVAPGESLRWRTWRPWSLKFLVRGLFICRLTQLRFLF